MNATEAAAVTALGTTAREDWSVYRRGSIERSIDEFLEKIDAMIETAARNPETSGDFVIVNPAEINVLDRDYLAVRNGVVSKLEDRGFVLEPTSGHKFWVTWGARAARNPEKRYWRDGSPKPARSGGIARLIRSWFGSAPEGT